MQQQKLKVAVIMGGLSSEKEISLESGRHIYNNLNRGKYEVIPVFMDSEARFWEIEENLVWMNTTMDIQNALKTGGKRLYFENLKKFTFAFLGLHGKYVEDGCLQGLLEILDIPYNGPGVLGSALGMDKNIAREFFKASGLNFPKSVVVNQKDINSERIKNKMENTGLNFPCIVKPTREGCSTALAKVINLEELYKAITEALKWDKEVLIEEDLSNGIEITTTVLGNEKPFALLPTETPKKGAFLTLEEKFLPGDAQMITPPHLPKKAIEAIQAESVKAYQSLGLKVYTRIDAFWKDKKLYILEPNTLPGVTPSTCVFHQAAEAGMNATQFFDKIIDLSFEAHSAKIGPL